MPEIQIAPGLFYYPWDIRMRKVFQYLTSLHFDSSVVGGRWDGAERPPLPPTEGWMGEQTSLEFDLTFGDVLLHKLVQAY